MPERTCIGCRGKGEASQFFRVSRNLEGELGIWTGIGRSAYIHREQKCIELAVQKGRLERALKSSVTGDERAVVQKVLECELR